MTNKFNSEFKIDLSNTENTSRNKSANNSRPDSKGRPRSSGNNRNKDLKRNSSNAGVFKLDDVLEIHSKSKEENTKTESLFDNYNGELHSAAS